MRRLLVVVAVVLLGFIAASVVAGRGSGASGSVESALVGASGKAAAVDPIEGLWVQERARTENGRWAEAAGGVVYVKPSETPKKFEGYVASKGGIRFAVETTADAAHGKHCVHPAGAMIWDMLKLPRSAYIGSHQGFYRDGCDTEGWPVSWSLVGKGVDAKLLFRVKNLYTSKGWWTVQFGREQALPDPIVPIETVSNGCGGDGFSGSIQHFLANKTSFVDGFLGKSYVVNFKPACDLHDAGYSGAKVKDEINGGPVDFFLWSRGRVDERFLKDNQKLCRLEIPPEANAALQDCLGVGETSWSASAQGRYNIVREYAADNYWKRPDLAGRWTDTADRLSPWTIQMSGRIVTATYPAAQGWVGRYRGILVSYDHDGIIKGRVTLTKGDQVIDARATLTITFVHLSERYTHFGLAITFDDGSRVTATMERS